MDRIVPTDKEAALRAIIDEMNRERKAICAALGCVDRPGVPLKFIGILRRDLDKAHERHVELLRSWDNATLTERQELDRLRRGWGPTTPTERMARHADLVDCLQVLSCAMSDVLTDVDEEADAEAAQKRLDEAYERLSKGYAQISALIGKMIESPANPDKHFTVFERVCGWLKRHSPLPPAGEVK